MQQLKPGDQQVFMLAQRDRGPPAFPPLRPSAIIEHGAEKSDNHVSALVSTAKNITVYP